MSILKVDVYSDFACPWCFIGKRHFDSAIKQYKGEYEIVYHPYMIDPNVQPEGEDYYKYNNRRWGGDYWTHSMKESATKDGITFKGWKVWANTFQAHRLMEYALQKQGWKKQNELKEFLFNHYFENGDNISLKEVLIKLGKEFGLENVEEFMNSSELSADVIKKDKYAKDELDIHGVPFYILNDKIILEGAQPKLAFIQAFNEAMK